jgi:adenine-specific DNA-methyltransferase
MAEKATSNKSDKIEIEAENGKLRKDIARLKKAVKQTKYGLVWMDIPEEFEEKARNAMPVLKEVPEKAVLNKDGKQTHILIEGDNYHALTCLNYTHKRKIDVIYIDPPFNTGAKDWKYNNNYVDKNDPWRHSKWINFMANRLRIAKYLLKRNGVLICAIDENEQAALGLLLEDLFPKYKRVCVTIIHNPRGIQGKNFSYCHEYAYFVYPDDGKVYIGTRTRDIASLRNLRDNGGGSLRTDGKTCFYPFHVKDGKVVGVGIVPPDDFRPKKQTIKKNGYYEVWPIDSSDNERKWRYSVNSFEDIKDLLHIKGDENEYQIHILKEEDRYRTVWTHKKYDANEHGSELLNRIINTKFPFPKSLYNIKECLDAVAKSNKEAIILDFFAGSGTTAHAMMEMNNEDEGRRQCILCTNNENNICEEVAYPRVERVINGYKYEGKEKEILYEKKLNISVLREAGDVLSEIESIKMMEGDKYEKYETKFEDNYIQLIGIKSIKGKKEGLGGSLKYYKTDFIGKNNVLNATDADKVELAHQAGELLAIAENTLYKVKENSHWQLYENGERYTAVYFREELDHFEKFVAMVENLKRLVTVYVFSWGDDEFDEAFEHIKGVKVKTIPLPILEIYKNIYNAG